MRGPKLCAILLGFGSFLVGATSLAEESPPAAAAPAAPDVVMLKSGGMFRGTIGEMDPKGDVVIVTVTSATRRFPMTDVAYAGPAASMPATHANEAPAAAAAAPLVGAAPATASDEKSAKLRVAGHGAPSLAVLARPVDAPAGTAYAKVCTAPCEAALPAGKYWFALATGKGKPVVEEQAAILKGPTQVEATYKSRAGARLAGGIVLGASVVTSGYLIATKDYDVTTMRCYSSSACTPTTQSVQSDTKLYAGLAVGIVGSIVGLALIAVQDGVDVRVAPLATVARAEHGPATDRLTWGERVGLSGLSVTAQF